MTPPENIFRFANVTASNREIPILENFDLTVKAGEKVVLKGRSGIGKTTVLRLLLGFRKPDSGRVFFRDEEVDEDTVWKVRREVAYVSQDVALGHGTVADFIDTVFSYRANQGRRPDGGRINSFLKTFELPEEILDKELADVSGGEKQRIAVLVALLLGRKTFILDEITAALDPDLRDKVMGFFLHDPAVTVLAVSHDVNTDLTGVRQVDMR
ncbi:MAG: ATP-binding cassette domain-containing protein [Lentisphaeria bacterium]